MCVNKVIIPLTVISNYSVNKIIISLNNDGIYSAYIVQMNIRYAAIKPLRKSIYSKNMYYNYFHMKN